MPSSQDGPGGAFHDDGGGEKWDDGEATKIRRVSIITNGNRKKTDLPPETASMKALREKVLSSTANHCQALPSTAQALRKHCASTVAH